MRKIAALAVTMCFLGLTAWAAPKDASMTGWISDSKCGAKGANAEHAACAQKCVTAGEKPVLVTDKDQKVLPIDNPDAVSAQVGQHVQVSGTTCSTQASCKDCCASIRVTDRSVAWFSRSPIQSRAHASGSGRSPACRDTAPR